MVLAQFEDFELGSSADGFLGRRCINCGVIVDPTIVIHQRLTSVTAAASNLAGSLSRIGPSRSDGRHGNAIKPEYQETSIVSFSDGAAILKGASR
jgi:hypothetical protein